MYCSIDKIDIAADVEGRFVAMQIDRRGRGEIEAEPELSQLFAMARVLNAHSQLVDDGHASSAVHYVVGDDPPDFLRTALAAVGATLERRGHVESLGPASEPAVGAIADRCFIALARRTAARVGTRDLAIALHMLEAQTFAAPPQRADDEVGYWCRVLELAALAGELLRAKYPGRWVQTDRALVPFGFQLATGAAVMFPTNRAQRVVEDGVDESLFKLLVAADETVHRAADPATGRLMPSLRARRDVQLDEVVWRPLLAEHAPADLPIIVCGIDGESTFGMIRREALAKPADLAIAEALRNLADEEAEVDVIDIGDDTIALVSGGFYAAEKLLDRDFMVALHEALGADLLAAATPARGQLLVTACSGASPRDGSALARFFAIVRERHDSSGGRAISPAVVLVRDGRVVGYVRGPGEHEPARADSDAARAATEPGSPDAPKRGILRRWLGRK